MKMEKLKRSLSFRKKKDHVPECSKPHQWLEDERKVREGTCSFQVRYLGCIEVFESRGMQVCEEAVKALKNQSKGKYQRAILYVSGDALRVVDEISKSMIVDQTIEKVSFCAPDRNHEKGFAYICRDGTTRRWICHGFMAVKESGERLSHAVGCAFAICLERKQKRDKESGVNVTFSQDRTSFARTGSFRQAPITERLADPQSTILAEPVPVRKVENPFAVQRPRATQSLLQRQGSFRGFEKLQETSSPFKRSVSLRLSDLPSTLKRQNAILESPLNNPGVNSPIAEMSPTEENPDTITQMCQQLSQGLHALNTDDPFASVPCTVAPPVLTNQGTGFATNSNQNVSSTEQTNPWANPVGREFWAKSSSPATSTNPFLLNTANSAVNGLPFGNKGSSSRHSLSHIRSHSIDTGELVSSGWHPNRKPTLQELATQRSFQHNGSVGWESSMPKAASNSTSPPTHGSAAPGVDPFDVAWAAKATKKQNSNLLPSKVAVKTFEVQL